MPTSTLHELITTQAYILGFLIVILFIFKRTRDFGCVLASIALPFESIFLVILAKNNGNLWLIILCLLFMNIMVLSYLAESFRLITGRKQKTKRKRGLVDEEAKRAKSDFWGKYVPHGVTYDPETDSYILHQSLLLGEGQFVIPDDEDQD